MNKISHQKQTTKACRRTREFRYVTLFAKKKSSLFQVLSFVNLWVSNATLKLIREQLEIAEHAFVD